MRNTRNSAEDPKREGKPKGKESERETNQEMLNYRKQTEGSRRGCGVGG